MDSLDFWDHFADVYGALLGKALSIGSASEATGQVASGATGGSASSYHPGAWDIPAPVAIYFDTPVTSLLDVLSSTSTSAAQTVTLQLVSDTGASAHDGITYDPSILVGATDDQRVVRLRGQLDGFGAAKDITGLLDADGSFVLDRAALAVLSGGGVLRDGSHDLTVIATDNDGRTTRASLHFMLDTLARGSSGLGLDGDSDTGYRGDGRTETAVVDLVGRSDAFAKVEVEGIWTTADSRGKFVIEDLLLETGRHDYEVHVTDLAGNISTTTLTLTRLENSVVHWNDVVLEAIKATSTAPMYATRLLAIESVALYEVVQAIEAQFPNSHIPVLGGFFGKFAANQEAAIAQAAYDILTSLYASDAGPYKGSAELRAGFANALQASLAEVPDGIGEWRGVALGHRIAQQILRERANDGWNAVVDPASEIGTDVGEWRPTPTGFANPLAPQWGHVATWMIDSADQFLPPPPPAIDSAEYASDYNLTKSVGAANSEALGLRTADQTQLAKFWADGAGTFTPPGHWNVIAGEIAGVEGRTTGEIAALYAKLNMALADAAITCWDAKFTYDYWRPVTAIRLGDTDGNEATAGDPNWTPLIATPPFPEYTSGHSTFSGAAAAILTGEFGANYAFTTGTPSTDPAIAGVTRSFTSFWAAANEAGASRVYGGIHFQSANEEGLTCGAQIGAWVLQKFGS